MNAPFLPATSLEATARWNGHAPSPFDWQALCVLSSGASHIYQFPAVSYDETRAVKAAQHWAKWDKAVAFLVRDTAGNVVHRGPVTNALGAALEPHWERALIKAGFGERRAAA